MPNEDVAHTYVELREPTLLASQHNFTFQAIGERWVYRFFSEFFDKTRR